MITVKEEFLTDAKTQRAIKVGGYEVLALWLAMKRYCAERLTDGFIPDEDIDALPGAPRKVRKALAALVNCGQLERDGSRKAGLVDEVPGGWQLHDYLDHACSREEIELKRERARIKKQAQRDKLRRELETLRAETGGVSGVVPRGQPQGQDRGTPPEVSRPRPAAPVRIGAHAHARTYPAQPNPTQPKEALESGWYSLDPSVPIELPPDWDPGAAILDGTPAAGVHNHERSLARFRAHHAGSGVTRTPMQWRQAFRVWATKDAQHDRSRPPAKATPQRQPDDPNVDLSVFELPWDDPRRAVLTGGGS